MGAGYNKRRHHRPQLQNQQPKRIEYCELVSKNAKSKNYQVFSVNATYKHRINTALNQLASDYPHLPNSFILDVATELLTTTPYLTGTNFQTRLADTIRNVKEAKIKQNQEVDFIEYAKSKMTPDELTKFEGLGKKVVARIKGAVEHIDSKKVRKHISDNAIDVKEEFTSALKGMLNDAKVYKTLRRGFPGGMTFRMSVMNYTPYRKVKKHVDDQFENLALRARLLLHIANTTTQLEDIFGITSKDIHAFYRDKIKEGKKYRHIARGLNRAPNGKKIHVNFRASDMTKRQIDLLIKSVTVDHIEEKKTWGADLSLQTGRDPIFGEDVFLPNMSKNLYVMPKYLNLIKNAIILSQLDTFNPDNDGKLFLNLVPEKGTKDGCFMYPYAHAYQLPSDKSNHHESKYEADGGKKGRPKANRKRKKGRNKGHKMNREVNWDHE